MEFEFDKEIDALLRQSAQGETVFTAANSTSQIPHRKSIHLDADEISAFAENALPERAKQAAMLHLADCENCRKTLSNLITLNAGAESETARIEKKQPEKRLIASPIPWHRKLFAFPNLAYTMGALVLIFSGIAAYTVLQNVGDSPNREVSQTYEKQPNGKGMSSDGDAAPTESYSSNMVSNANTMMSNAASMNSTANTAANFPNSAMPSAPAATAMNSNAAAPRRESSEKNTSGESKSFAPQNETADVVVTQESVVAAAPPPKPTAKEDDYQSDGETITVQPNQTQQNSIAQNQTNITPDSRNAQQQRAPMPTTLPMNGRRSNKKLQDSKEEQEKTIETTSVGGKNFKRTDNVWYDSAYRGQPTKNVARGTSEYKKLDSGLRAVAENLGGTIVIVWKEKAYRIQ